jgi:hypothetical protein
VVNGIGGLSIPVLKADLGVPVLPVGPEYGKMILQRCKGKLDKLASDGKLDGKLDGKHGGVFQY